MKKSLIQWVKLGRFRTRLLSLGRGEPILFVHSFLGSLEHWSYLLLPLRKDFSLYAFDLPGFGYSPHPSPPPTLSDYVGCLHRLCEQKQLSSVHLVGNSLGGLIAARFALSFPEKTKTLTLVDSAGFSLFLPTRASNLTTFLLPVTPLLGIVKPPAAFVKTIIRLCFAQESRASRALAEQFTAYLQTKDMRTWMKVLGSVVFSILRKHVREEAADISAPTLVVWGKEDRVLPWNNAFYAVSRIPHSYGVIFRNCGHFPQMERPKDFVAILKPFLKGEKLKKWQVL